MEDGGRAVEAVAAYIDLNPVRAGIVEDPKDYRFSGYSAALADNSLARRGLMSVGDKQPWTQQAAWYRMRLFAGAGTAHQMGKHVLSDERIDAVLARGGRLSVGEMPRRHSGPKLRVAAPDRRALDFPPRTRHAASMKHEVALAGVSSSARPVRASFRAAAWPCWAVGVLAAWALSLTPFARMPDPPGQPQPGAQPAHEAYLFAHMMHGDYGRLYYSVSRDGLHWREINGGRRVFEGYRGHADICRGHDGRFYLVGNRNDGAPDINFWVSTNLIQWRKHADYVPDLKRVPNYPKALPRIGAPKLFYDASRSLYLLTWHTTHDLGKTDLPEPYWAGQRTLYATSRDLLTFSDPPRRLFDGDMATIDTIVRKAGDHYYAIIKDERYPSLEWPTGKTIRVSSGPDLLGPYSEPGPPVSPSFREAPTLIPSPNGVAWYLYYEQYPGVGYGLSVATHLDGPWFQPAGNMHYQDWDKYEVPAKARHGSMLPITLPEYEALTNAFGIAAAPTTAPAAR